MDSFLHPMEWVNFIACFMLMESDHDGENRQKQKSPSYFLFFSFHSDYLNYYWFSIPEAET